MNREVKSQNYLRKRKKMLVLPLLVIPFLTMAFWAMGGGRSESVRSTQKERAGLNVKLPDVAGKDEQLMDKLGFYEKAKKDSLRLAEWMRSDPYYQQPPFTSDTTTPNELLQIHQATASKYNQALNTSPYEKGGEAPEDKIMQRISELQKGLNKNATISREQSKPTYSSKSEHEISSQVDRLEDMMQSMNSTSSEDPEINRLENTLDKILDIQHPQRVKDRLKEKSLQDKTAAFPVTKETGYTPISLLSEKKTSSNYTNRFYGLSEEVTVKDQNAVQAVVHESQTLVDGSIVKFRLLDDIYLAGIRVPKDNFVYGVASLNNERLEIEVSSIRYGASIYPVKLQVFDLDGLSGIHIPGAITRDVAKQSADNSLQLIELSSMDPSLKAQAATAGISAAKSLLSKKAKLIKVSIKAGYKVLLYNNSSN